VHSQLPTLGAPSPSQPAPAAKPLPPLERFHLVVPPEVLQAYANEPYTKILTAYRDAKISRLEYLVQEQAKVIVDLNSRIAALEAEPNSPVADGKDNQK